MEQHKQGEETGHLRTRCDQRGALGRRPLVNLRSPHVEGRGCNLEAQSRHHHDDGNRQQRIARRSVDCGGDALQRERAREAVEQAEAEEQDTRRHAAKKKILEPCFRRWLALLIKRGKDVKRKTQELNGDEDEQQVLRAHQQHHRGGGKQDQRTILAHVGGEARRGDQEKNKDCQYEEGDLHQLRQRIDHQHSRGQAALGREFHQHSQCDRASDGGSDRRETEADRKRRPAQEAEIQYQDQEPRQSDHDLGRRQAQKFCHLHAPWRSCSNNGPLRLGRIRSISSLG